MELVEALDVVVALALVVALVVALVLVVVLVVALDAPPAPLDVVSCDTAPEQAPSAARAMGSQGKRRCMIDLFRPILPTHEQRPQRPLLPLRPLRDRDQ